VVDIFQVQAGLIFEELDATAMLEGWRLVADAFDLQVWQSIAIEFADYDRVCGLYCRARIDAKSDQSGDVWGRIFCDGLRRFWYR
jgi:hypothetical protein